MLNKKRLLKETVVSLKGRCTRKIRNRATFLLINKVPGLRENSSVWYESTARKERASEAVERDYDVFQGRASATRRKVPDEKEERTLAEARAAASAISGSAFRESREGVLISDVPPPLPPANSREVRETRTIGPE